MVRSFRDWLKIIVGGMCMGMANIVPGVSGGTMAFILGIYGRLLDSINSINSRTLGLFFRGRWRLAFQEISWRFLLAIGVGVGISLVSLAKGISVLLQHPIYRSYLFAFFFGLILASVGFCIRQVNQWRLQHFAVLGVGVVVAFTLTMVHFDSESGDSHFDVHIPKERIVVLAEGMDIQNYSTESSSLMGVSHATLSAMIAKDVIGRQTMVYSYQQHKMGTAEEFVQAGSASFIDWWLILCGMVTVSAMLLPGVSGSYILVIFGAYAPVVGAVADFSTGITALSVSTGTLVILLNFFCGMVLGALGFSRVVSWLLRHHRGVDDRNTHRVCPGGDRSCMAFLVL